MAKKNIAEEVIDCCIEQDFNPDIVLDGVREAYEVGLREGFFKGFAVGFGFWVVSLLALLLLLLKSPISVRRTKRSP